MSVRGFNMRGAGPRDGGRCTLQLLTVFPFLAQFLSSSFLPLPFSACKPNASVGAQNCISTLPSHQS